ncbi:hypothetical protein [Ruegeria sp. HKCCSP351]|uniref:hypothetical protein n=1 Tax=Ruegeria sp. HKCCSP351 TaxID=2794832 RepID=UPI001AE5FDD3|nr:hypothetical protein [Ruegeria sp. HKCCSP351]
MKSNMRQAAWLTVCWTIAALSMAVALGFGTAASLAALAAAGLSLPIRLFIMGCIWFGFAGIAALMATLNKGHNMQEQAMEKRPLPPMADAFTAGMAEGAAMASRNRSG